VSGAELISPKALHKARQLRDAEAADPGLIRRTLEARLEQREEPILYRNFDMALS